MFFTNISLDSEQTTLHTCTIRCNAFDKGNYVIRTSIDSYKAFDSISYEILLKELNQYGMRGVALKCFSSYLYNRTQIVSVNGVL